MNTRAKSASAPRRRWACSPSHAIGCDSARQFARAPLAEEPTKKESHEPDRPRLRVTTPDADREGRPGAAPRARSTQQVHRARPNSARTRQPAHLDRQRCAYCIATHTKDARQAGESEQRLYALAAWRVSPLFSDRERAALALTDAITLINDEHLPRAVWEEAAALFSEDELAQLLWAITAMNAWNRIAIATRMESPYERTPYDNPLLQAASS
jgi:Carboxymuconolactone decarboxylase family